MKQSIQVDLIEAEVLLQQTFANRWSIDADSVCVQINTQGAVHNGSACAAALTRDQMRETQNVNVGVILDALVGPLVRTERTLMPAIKKLREIASEMSLGDAKAATENWDDYRAECKRQGRIVTNLVAPNTPVLFPIGPEL